MTREKYDMLQNLNGIHCVIPMLSGKIDVLNCEYVTNDQIWFDAPHSHQCSEMLLVLKGVLHFNLEGKPLTLQEGECLYVHDHVEHHMDFLGEYNRILILYLNYRPEEKMERVLSEYNEDEVSLLNNLFSQRHQKLTLTEDAWMELEYLMGYVQHGYVGNYIKMRNCLDHLIMSVCQATYPIKSNPMHFEFYRKYQNQNKIYRMNAYIREHFAEEISVENIADYLHYTPRHVQRLIMEFYNTSLTKMILAYRISDAKHLLATTNLKIDEICVRSGFGNIKNMEKHFHIEVGMSPVLYRRYVRSHRPQELVEA